MFLLVGLGNPGSQYAGNRHNIGFMALDEIQRQYGFSAWSRKFKGEMSEGQIGAEKTVLLKPLTFMNVSGESVGDAARFFKLEPDRIAVIHDELDLAPGKVRAKLGGGNGGHNGLKSIDAHLGKDYRRIRLGIGHPGSKERVNGHVLSDFHKSDREWLEPLLDAVARNIDAIVVGEDAQFMNRVHLALESDEPPSARGSPEAAAMKPNGQSHIRSARTGPKPKLPTSGPMADMLKRMFGGKD